MFAIALSLSLLLPVQKAPAAKPVVKADDPVVELLDESIAKTIEDIVG